MADKSQYLVVYNAVSAFLWLSVLFRLIILYFLVGHEWVSGGLADFTRWVQTLALLEVVHSMLGLVKSPVITTLMQVASRLLLVWGVLYLFPQVGTYFPFCTMVLAWSITEITRYSYYVINIQRGAAAIPRALIWMRYNAFFVLYPLGAGSEVLLTFLSLDDAYKWSPLYSLFLKAVLIIYIPGFYVLFTHMIKQRRRVYKNIGKRKAD